MPHQETGDIHLLALFDITGWGNKDPSHTCTHRGHGDTQHTDLGDGHTHTHGLDWGDTTQTRNSSSGHMTQEQTLGVHI